VNLLDMQVIVSNIPPTIVDKHKDKLLRYVFPPVPMWFGLLVLMRGGPRERVK